MRSATARPQSLCVGGGWEDLGLRSNKRPSYVALWNMVESISVDGDSGALVEIPCMCVCV